MKFLCLITGLLLLWSSVGFAGECLVYFGTYTGARSKGIYVSRFDPAMGRLSPPELAAAIQNPSFLALHPNGHFLYAVEEVDGTGGKPGGTVSAFSLDRQTGKLMLLNRQASGGNAPCHLSVDATGRCLLVANYNSGSIAALPIHADGRLGEAGTILQHTGHGANPGRQAGPHAHFICPSPDNRFALNCDLGLDEVLVYHLDPDAAKLVPGDPPFAPGAPGAGPRHLTFSPDGRFVYVINEMGSTITVFAYDPARAAMTEVQTLSTLPGDFSAHNTSAEIVMHPSGKFLYGSNRGHDSIAVYVVDRKSGRLTPVEYQSAQGRTPRHIALDPTGRWLLAENQDSDSVIVFALDPDTGRLKPTGQSLAIGSPVCAVFVGAK